MTLIRVWLVVLLLLVGTAARAQQPPTPTFDLVEFEVEGNTVLMPLTVERALLPHMGPGKQIADVEAARAALEQAYQQGGWLTVFVDVPEQRIEGGVVRLNVTEGRVGTVRVTGSRYFSQGWIRRVADELQEGEVPNFNVVQTQLAELNRGAARQVQPVLKPGAVPGTVDAELKVVDQLPLAAGLELKTYHAPGAERLRVAGNIRWDNLFQRDHSVALSAGTVPAEPSQSRFVALAYTVPRGDGAWLGTAVWSDSELAPLGAATVLGRNTTLGLRRLQSFFGRDSSQTLSFGAEFKDLSERFISGGSELSTPLRYLPFQAAHTGQWQHGAGVQTSLSTTFTFASSRLLDRRIDCPGNVGPVDQFACRRQGADGGFAWLRGDLRHNRNLLGGQFSLRLAGQWAQQPLVGGEQFSVGGSDTVRGFYDGEAVGDHALLASVEWRSTNLAPRRAGNDSQPWLNDLSLLVFVDAARVTILEPLAEQAARVPLLGSGIGLRLRAGGDVTAAVDVAWPHKPARDNPDRDPRVHARLGVQF